MCVCVLLCQVAYAERCLGINVQNDSRELFDFVQQLVFNLEPALLIQSYAFRLIWWIHMALSFQLAYCDS